MPHIGSTLVAAGALLVAALPSTARADRDEASFHPQVSYGRVTLGDTEAGSLTDMGSYRGIGGRFTYATSDWYAYETQFSLGSTGTLRYDLDADSVLFRSPQWGRLDIGMSARLGALWIPTVQGAIGMQVRSSGDGYLNEVDCIKTADPRWNVEIIGTLGLGLDYRFAAHWILGGNVTLQRDVLAGPGFDAIGGTFHIAYYWYWFPSWNDDWKDGLDGLDGLE